MTKAARIRAVCDYLRHHARGRAAAVRLDDLAAALGWSRRFLENALHEAACEGRPVGTSCTNLDGEQGEGVRSRGMGAFWIVTMADWDAAVAILMPRFRPIRDRLNGLDLCKPRVGAEPVEEARRELARVTGEAPALMDKRGQRLIFNPSGHE